MDETIKQKWVAELRSGKYQQGKQFLKQRLPGQLEYHYCCLGVLCELYIQETGKNIAELISDNIVYFGGAACSLPAEVVAWAGLDYGLPEVVLEPGDPDYGFLSRRKLSCLNDIGIPFEEIAGIIERRL